MKALEPYPPFNRNADNVPETSDDYAHVKHFSGGRTCGTLSKSEWEASSKYITNITFFSHKITYFGVDVHIFQLYTWFLPSKK